METIKDFIKKIVKNAPGNQEKNPDASYTSYI
jgi:hypothetical protein